MFRENYSALLGSASRTTEIMVLNVSDNPHHICEDQLSVACPTTHRPYSK
jgi:hypothetical protein